MIVSTFILLCGLVQAEPTTTQTVEEFGPLKIGKPIPTFAGWTTKALPWSFSRDRSRRPLIISYFATWCKPCIKGIPIMERVAAQEKSDLLLISIDEKEGIVKRFLEKHNIKSVTIVDTYKEIAKRHGVIQGDTVNSIPKTFLIDKKNVLRVIYTKEGDNFGTLLQKNIRALKEPSPSLNQKPPPDDSSPSQPAPQ